MLRAGFVVVMDFLLTADHHRVYSLTRVSFNHTSVMESSSCFFVMRLCFGLDKWVGGDENRDWW
jgi:hypothetical protein